MQNIQESAASMCVERIDLAKFALSLRAPLMMNDFNADRSERTEEFTKHDFEQALAKVSRKIKK